MAKSILLICGVAILAAFSALATQLKPLTIEQLIAAGETVVYGVVTSKTVQRDADGRIVTRVQLTTKERWKGSKPVVSIVYAGGVLGDKAVFADGQEQYDIGEEVVTFVRFNTRGDAVTVGMSQGKFTVFEHNGETFVANGLHGASQSEVPKRGPQNALRLNELKARVSGGDR
ncbi:MAG TPA: hypothetical protein VJ063_14540 [Verrucomicrobiae bacterium]|nr:hypothetical protein [Verrucomicrobiae bacterium]